MDSSHTPVQPRHTQSRGAPWQRASTALSGTARLAPLSVTGRGADASTARGATASMAGNTPRLPEPDSTCSTWPLRTSATSSCSWICARSSPAYQCSGPVWVARKKRSPALCDGDTARAALGAFAAVTHPAVPLPAVHGT